MDQEIVNKLIGALERVIEREYDQDEESRNFRDEDLSSWRILIDIAKREPKLEAHKKRRRKWFVKKGDTTLHTKIFEEGQRYEVAETFGEDNTEAEDRALLVTMAVNHFDKLLRLLKELTWYAEHAQAIHFPTSTIIEAKSLISTIKKEGTIIKWTF